MKLRARGNLVEWEGGHLDLQAPVIEAVRLGDRILVVHDYMAFSQDRPAANLVAYSPRGERLWVAENLTLSSATDAYVGFLSEEPLWVGNFEGFRCRIDPETGQLLASEFTK
jgi:hypothetical protein